MAEAILRGIRSAQAGLLINAVLAVIKLIAGLVGHSYALVADAIESAADVFSSLIVWGGLHIARRSADDDYPFGYGKAESLAAAVVGLLLLGAAIGVAILAAREIATPHHAPAPFTLAVLVGVILVKVSFAACCGWAPRSGARRCRRTHGTIAATRSPRRPHSSGSPSR